ncbi:MAG TPA: tetratricopeptide repeat protein [Anaerolineales bacterium]|nr:tetratricopeptide repeat protein [Anaerolineales bacterium]
MLKNGKTFDENIRTLSGELELAVRWKRPSLLLAICPSKLSQNKAEIVLERLMQKLGQAVVRVNINEKQPDAAHAILAQGRADRSIFFVSNLDQGGGADGKDAYRTLNIYRELFVEQGLRCVFWLSLNEASNLPKFAPDFWAFRHRVIEFASSHGSTRTSLPADVLTWPLRDFNDSPQDLREKIRGREELLGQLPDRTESALARAELLSELGYLYWRLGENEKAMQSLTGGMAMAENKELAQVRSWLLNGLAILAYERHEYQEAFEIYSKILKGGSQDGFLWMNLAVTTSALGRNNEAVVHGRRALRLVSTDARLWNTMGHLHIWMGKLDEASSFFKKAIELAPTVPAHHLALAACCSSLGLLDESQSEISLARRHSEGPGPYLDICQEAILGNPETAFHSLKAAVRNGQMTRTDVKRDPVLNEILDHVLIETSL